MKKRCAAKTSKGVRCRNMSIFVFCARHKGMRDPALADDLTPAERADAEAAKRSPDDKPAAPDRCVAKMKGGKRCPNPCDKDGEWLLCADHLKDARRGDHVTAACEGQSGGREIAVKTRRLVRRERPRLWLVDMITSQRGAMIAAAFFLPMLLLTEVVEAIELGLPLTFLPINLNLAPMLVARAPETLLSLGIVIILVAAVLAVVALIAAMIVFFVVKPSILWLPLAICLALAGFLFAIIASLIVGAANLTLRALWLTLGVALWLVFLVSRFFRWRSMAFRVELVARAALRRGALGFFNSNWSIAAVKRIWAPAALWWERVRSGVIDNVRGTKILVSRLFDRFFVNTMLSGRSGVWVIGTRVALYGLTMLLMVEVTQFLAAERIARVEAAVRSDRALTLDTDVRTASAAPAFRTASLAAPPALMVATLEEAEGRIEDDLGDGEEVEAGACDGTISPEGRIMGWSPPLPDALLVARISLFEGACGLFEWLSSPAPIGRLVMKGDASRDASFISPTGLQPPRDATDIQTADAERGVAPDAAALPWPKELSRKVVYLGDYGDWALLAPLRGWPNDRVLVRRSNIVEFSEADDERREPVAALHRLGQVEGVKTALETLSASQLLAEERILRMREDLGEAAAEVDELRREFRGLRDEVAGEVADVARKAADKSLARIALATAHRARPTEELLAITQRLDQLARDRGGAGGTSQVWILNGDPGQMRAASAADGDVTQDFDRLRNDPAYRACFEEDGPAGFAIRFPVNRAVAKDVWRGELDAIARKLTSGGEPQVAPTLVLIRGAASASGAADHNRRLSERRADWVAKELKARVRATAPKSSLLLVPFGVGERLPDRFDSGHDPDEIARNVTIRICEASRGSETAMNGSTEDPEQTN